jgi:hypothetical protein
VPVLLFLALLWAAVLVPVFLKALAARRAYFASSFGDGLHALEQAEGFFAQDERHEAADADDGPPGRLGVTVNAALLRSVLAGLLIAVLVSGALAVLTAERSMLAVNLALDNCLLLFVAFLVLRRDARAEALAPALTTRDLATAATAAIATAPTEAAPAPGRAQAAPAPRRVYSGGTPVIAAPVVGALSGSVASAAAG